MRFDGRVAVLTGGGSGIGAATVEVLALDGDEPRTLGVGTHERRTVKRA